MDSCFEYAVLVDYLYILKSSNLVHIYHLDSFQNFLNCYLLLL